ncbi:MAG: nucleoside kinase [Tidjanibacter sp.]|nr:nucleoside kinase [Tidjanibacter sp.]
MEHIKIVCKNCNSELFVDWGTRLKDVAKMIATPDKKEPWLAAYVNNSIRELDYRICEPVTVKFIDITHFEGIRVYQRTLFMILHKAVHDLYPDNRFRIKHSLSKGFYCELEGITPSEEVAARVRERVDELIAQNIPIVRNKMLKEEAIEIYRQLGFEDKIAIINSRPHLYVTVYRLADMAGYFYGALAPSTGLIHLYDFRPYGEGFHITCPRRTEPSKLENVVPQQKMYEVFSEYKDWVDIIGVSNVGPLNQMISNGKSTGLIQIAEALHEKKIGKIADTIAEAHAERGVRMVLIAGPSSSGKTTFCKRLGIGLGVLGFHPQSISLDDYFVDRTKTPRDESGDYDFEALEAIDLELFNDHLRRLFAGEAVVLPRYNFITGLREWHDKPLQLDDRSILLVEGIHGLNPRLTDGVADNLKFRVYISALTSISMDDLSRIPTTDNRLLRRMIRDFATRGCDATATLQRWASVRKGEDKHIFPYQENADVMFNSSLFYEIPVLKAYALPLLHSVPDTVEEYAEARRLFKFLDNFLPIDTNDIPPTSILREFVGGSSFKY